MTSPESATVDDEAIRRAERIHAAVPDGGLFAEKAWRISPEPFPLDKKLVRELEKLGPLLLRFQQSCDLVYRRSRKGTLPGWIADYLDRGKPGSLLDLGAAPAVRETAPRVIRPDLILTEDGFRATELDSVPGGIGLTAWLGQIYHELDPEAEIVGGPDGMRTGFSSLFDAGGVDVAVSEESAGYRPEMEWLVSTLEGDWRVVSAETCEPSDRAVYRFFELFDLPNIPAAEALGRAAAAGDIDLVSPFKPWLEEKMWSALFHSLPLREVWRRELREGNWKRLRRVFPDSWVVDPAEVPPHAGIPGLGIRQFSEMTEFSQRERELVLKLSGFDERAWGSRSVTVGQDVSQSNWAAAVDEALESFESSPYVLQRFHPGRIVHHPWFDPESGGMKTMEGRVRLCPYYFVDAAEGKVSLGGVLATICPADKKVLHGMRDAILAPCRIERQP